MQFGILGSIEVRRTDGDPIAVGGPQVRALLALLALDAGKLVSRERLIDGLYGEDPPGDAAHALQSQVSRLRRALRATAGPATAGPATVGSATAGSGKAGSAATGASAGGPVGTSTGSATSEFVESSPAGYRLAVESGAVDAHRFARLAEQGRNALRDRDPAAAATLLDQALACWRGPALADVLDAPFAEVQVARLDEARLSVLADRAEAALALGDHHSVVATLPELVAAHPLRERLRALLMRALYAAGRQSDALESFEQGRRLLAEELGADPGAELTEAHLAILRADAAPAPAVRRLPAQFTSFIGRETELAQLIPLLARSRLVTIAGPGGTGKTRLSLEVGARVQGEVCVVELAALADGAQVAPAVVAALGGRDSTGGRDPETQLLAMLADRPLLLILDNSEHLVLDTAHLTHRLLRACPGLRVLVTSREPLAITGEAVFPLGQLPIAAPEAALAEQLNSPAIRLFADRAAAAKPGFTVDAGTIGAVRRICARLDGLPLAIELAAARLRTLDIDDIDARLTDRFRLLSRGARTAEPRHATLHAVVAWSWDLLTPAERQLAQRFTIFANGATLAAAQHICNPAIGGETLRGSAENTDTSAENTDTSAERQNAGAENQNAGAENQNVGAENRNAGAEGRNAGAEDQGAGVETWLDDREFPGDVDELLSGLVDKSLVVAVSGRYRMLETIREFGLRELRDSGDHDRLLRAHAEFYLRLAEHSEPALRGPDQLTHLARLTADHDNLQAALHWSARADPALAQRLIASQAWYWWLTGRPGDAPALARRLLTGLSPDIAAGPARTGADTPGTEVLSDPVIPGSRPADLYLARGLGDSGDPHPGFGRTEATSGRAPSDFEGARTGSGRRTELDSGKAGGEFARAKQNSSGDAEEFALCVTVAARGAKAFDAAGHAVAAEYTTVIAQAAAAVARLETPLRRPYLVLLLAFAGERIPGDPDRMRQLFGSDPWSQAFVRLGDGLGLFMSGRAAESEPEFLAALAGFRSIGDRWAIAATLDKLTAVAELRGDHGTALTLIDEAIAMGTELGMVADIADLLSRRGDICAGGDEAERDRARADYERAAELARTIGASDMRANALRGLGDLALDTDRVAARAHYEAALSLPADNSIGAAESRARTLIGLGRLSIAEQDAGQAFSHYRAALDLAVDNSLSPVAASAVEQMAAASFETGAVEATAVLLGAAEGMRGLTRTGDSEVSDLAEQCRKILGDRDFEAAFSRGVALPVDQAVALAQIGPVQDR
ncbi:BTAD domain-containing putative transcriptional regulator [Nocardia sp. NPDC056100]|uniref:BTAD domain-containing putative transcriptional regulator n=1 Tax=Nocardia sp. NPDC056100 TaxID=3345712 RepID=UPI0035DDD0F8